MDKDRLKSLKTQMEIAIIAVGRERKSQEFYLKASKSAIDEESREMFIVLANEEKRHLEKMEHLLENIKSLYDEEKRGK